MYSSSQLDRRKTKTPPKKSHFGLPKKTLSVKKIKNVPNLCKADGATNFFHKKIKRLIFVCHRVTRLNGQEERATPRKFILFLHISTNLILKQRKTFWIKSLKQPVQQKESFETQKRRTTLQLLSMKRFRLHHYTLCLEQIEDKNQLVKITANSSRFTLLQKTRYSAGRKGFILSIIRVLLLLF